MDINWFALSVCFSHIFPPRTKHQPGQGHAYHVETAGDPCQFIWLAGEHVARHGWQVVEGKRYEQACYGSFNSCLHI